MDMNVTHSQYNAFTIPGNTRNNQTRTYPFNAANSLFKLSFASPNSIMHFEL
jgi:hypothetical protein